MVDSNIKVIKEKGPTFLPNTFQHPNFTVDWLAYYLTPEEQVVLDKALREILGWRNTIAARRARIALSVFVEGKRSKEENEITCLGCGLGITAVRTALKVLHEFNILVKVGTITGDGQEFALSEATDINWEALSARREEWDRANHNRIQLATVAATERRVVSSDGTTPLSSDGTTPLSSDNNKETQLETQLETHASQNAMPDNERLRALQARLLRSTITKTEEEQELSPLGEYIRQQMNECPSKEDRRLLTMAYTEQTPAGPIRHPCANVLWDTNPAFRDYVAEEVAHYKNRRDMTPAIRRKNLVRVITSFHHSSGHGWLDRKGDDPYTPSTPPPPVVPPDSGLTEDELIAHFSGLKNEPMPDIGIR